METAGSHPPLGVNRFLSSLCFTSTARTLFSAGGVTDTLASVIELAVTTIEGFVIILGCARALAPSRCR